MLTGLTDAWLGTSAVEMTTALLPYITWMETTATQAGMVGTQAQAAAGAAAAVKAAVVPPPVIAANRAQLLNLIATNILGQNTAAIAALEAQYEAMWAQDTTAMNVYDTTSQGAVSALPKFSAAPNTTSGVDPPVAAAAAPAQATSFLEFLQQLFPGLTLGDPLGNLADILLSPLGLAFISSGDPLSLLGALLGLISLGTAAEAAGTAQAAMGAASAAMAAPRGGGAPSVSVNTPAPAPQAKAATGVANRLGGMRVPPSWAQPQQETKAAEPLRPTPEGGKKNVPIGLPVIPAVPVTGGKAGQKKGTKFEDLDYGEPVAPILNRHPSGG